MKVTPEINKAVAEAMGYITEMYQGELCIQTDEIHRYGKTILKIWQPHLNAEQCLKVLEWLKNQPYEISLDNLGF